LTRTIPPFLCTYTYLPLYIDSVHYAMNDNSEKWLSKASQMIHPALTNQPTNPSPQYFVQSKAMQLTKKILPNAIKYFDHAVLFAAALHVFRLQHDKFKLFSIRKEKIKTTKFHFLNNLQSRSRSRSVRKTTKKLLLSYYYFFCVLNVPTEIN